MTKRQIDFIRKLAFKHKVNFQLRKDQQGNYLADLTSDSYPITVSVSDFQRAKQNIQDIAEYRYEGNAYERAKRFGQRY
ncbi:MAG: hypothetical protein RIG62_15000 [Cyclobacteriaceae bacterium]